MRGRGHPKQPCLDFLGYRVIGQAFPAFGLDSQTNKRRCGARSRVHNATTL